MDIGTVIKTFRKRSGYYQEDLARKLGLTKQAICNWENGRTEPNLEMLYKLSKIFGVTVDELINGEYGEQLKTRNNQEYVFLSEFRNADETTRQMVMRILAYNKFGDNENENSET